MNNIVGLQLEPLDVLFFRDGRPFTPASRGKSLLPMPQTLAGAVWTAILQKLGCDFQALRRLLQNENRDLADALRELCQADWLTSLIVRGPWLARWKNGELEVLVAVPAVVSAPKNRRPGDGSPLHRLRPRSPGRLPGWTASLPSGQAEMWPLWHQQTEPTEPATGYLTPRGLRDFLANGDIPSDEVVDGSDLFDFDHRTGIGVDPDRLTAQESLIYAASFLALRPDVFLYAEVGLPIDRGPDVFDGISTMTIGGEGRRAGLSALSRPFDWNAVECPPAVGDQKPMILLTTPAILSAGWKSAWDNARLVAAAVSGHVAVSGWDMARGGPKPTRFAVPAGSTYFFEDTPNQPPIALSDEADDQRQGWGCYVTGVWTE